MQLRDYIKAYDRVTQTQIARAFNIAPSALEQMLSLLVQKNMIVVCNERPTCKKTCGGCAQNTPVCYQIAPLDRRE